MTADIEIHSWSNDWPKAFAAIADGLRALIGDNVRIEHIGSTAVEHLGAKPIIDVIVGVDDSSQINLAARRLELAGYRRGRPIQGNDVAAFLDRQEPAPAVNIHVVELSSRAWRDLIGFRDRLRASPEIAAEYETLKRRLAATTADLGAYTDGKSAFIRNALDD